MKKAVKRFTTKRKKGKKLNKGVVTAIGLPPHEILPTEVLLHIFYFLAPEYNDDEIEVRISALRRLSSCRLVCRAWNEVVVNCMDLSELIKRNQLIQQGDFFVWAMALNLNKYELSPPPDLSRIAYCNALRFFFEVVAFGDLTEDLRLTCIDTDAEEAKLRWQMQLQTLESTPKIELKWWRKRHLLILFTSCQITLIDPFREEEKRVVATWEPAKALIKSVYIRGDQIYIITATGTKKCEGTPFVKPLMD